MKNLIKLLLLFVIANGMSSCWVTTQIKVRPSTGIQNEFEVLKGKTKNEILQAMGVPDRSMSDGNGGEIMRYENREFVTSSYANSSTTTNNRSGVVAGYNAYGNPAAYGASRSNTNYGYASNTTTSEKVQFVEAFINGQGVCYNVRANYGDIYETKCVRVPNESLLWWLMPPFTVVPGIPVTIWYLCNKNKVKPCRK